MARIFREQNSGESLDHFAERAVRTTPLERTRFGEDVERFVLCLHSQAFRAPYSVKEVLKSGSLGKGTAVRSLADIDLVVFVNGLSSIEDLQRTRGWPLEDLEGKVKTLLRIWPVKRTRFSLSFEWQGHKVDILPAFDLRSRYGPPSSVYEAMKRFGSVQDAAQEFSVSLAPLQVQFVKTIPEHVKKVIRLIKLWNEENDVGLRSYSIELLTIYVWRRSGEGNPGTNYLFREVMRELANCGNLRVAFGDNYDFCNYIRVSLERISLTDGQGLALPSDITMALQCPPAVSASPTDWVAHRYMATPYIMDPANPFMNTLDGVNAHRVSDCAKKVVWSI